MTDATEISAEPKPAPFRYEKYIGRHIIVGLLLFAGYLGYGLAQPHLLAKRAAADAAAKMVAQQTVLTNYALITSQVNAALRDGMARDPGLDRIRIAFMHSPATQENLPLLRWDLTHSLTKQGHIVGALKTDLQVSDWSDYFDALFANTCASVNIGTMQSEATLARIREMHLKGFIVCPIYSVNHALIGAVFGSWDEGSPEPVDIAATSAVLRDVAQRIGSAVPPAL